MWSTSTMALLTTSPASSTRPMSVVLERGWDVHLVASQEALPIFAREFAKANYGQERPAAARRSAYGPSAPWASGAHTPPGGRPPAPS